MFLPVLLAALPAGSIGSLAQMQTCAAAQTQTDMNECTAREYKKHDAAMNEVYRQLLAKLKDARQKEMLVEAERAWAAYRDKFCAFQSSETVSGSIHPLIETNCLDEKTNVHNAELTRQLNCGEGDPSCVH